MNTGINNYSQKGKIQRSEEIKKFLIMCMLFIGVTLFSVLPVQAAAPKMYTLQTGKTYKQYDITGNEKKDKLKISLVKGTYDGYWGGMNIYVNNRKVYSVSENFMSLSSRIITLSNDKTFLCLRGSTEDDISIFHGLYQYRDDKIVQVVNFLNENYERSLDEAYIYLKGNSITVRTEAMSYSLGSCVTEFTYKYQNGSLIRTSCYGKYTQLNAADEKTGLFMAARNIQSYTTPASGKKAFVIPKKSAVKILNCWTDGNKMYIHIKCGSRTGWIKAVTLKQSLGHAGSPQFSNVIYTG